MRIAISLALTQPGGASGSAPAETFHIETESGDVLTGESGDHVQQESAP